MDRDKVGPQDRAVCSYRWSCTNASVEPQETNDVPGGKAKLCEVVARDPGPNKSFDHICDVLSGPTGSGVSGYAADLHI